MQAYRIFVEKKPRFRVEAESLRRELNEQLRLQLDGLRLLNVYDLFGFTPELLEQCRYRVFGEAVTDEVSDACNLDGLQYLATEYLPGQFDQRAASAEACVRLVDPRAEVHIKSSRLIVLQGKIEDGALERIRRYFINPIESREKDLSLLAAPVPAPAREVPVLDGFTAWTDGELEARRRDLGLAMSADDLREVVGYFRREGRDPNETELRILDTYWSDHCRHTTFHTQLEDIAVEDSFLREDIEGSLRLYDEMRKELGREDRPRCLMDLATIGAKWLKRRGLLDDLEESEENNACSIRVTADNDGVPEEWLLMFKNETHNHPTEIEPFGGAATCIGGAVRDPLSGRSYVYQALRVTGAGNIRETVEETLPGKLPQRVLSRRAASGYSSYGNQLGLATAQVREMLHPGYTAKRLELGAVVGAVKARNVRRETPEPGDVLLLLGGRTGRDGIGGATGSSKEQTETSIETCGSEVQKGNAPEERKLQRLFRRPEAARLIRKANDFGAGGVSVALGELADGLDIYLDRVPLKYSGLDNTEIAISESQERMAVVLRAGDEEAFVRYCRQENVEATHVGDVTATGRMRLFRDGKLAADLSREFIDSAGAPRRTAAVIAAVEDRDPFLPPEAGGLSLKERLLALMRRPSVSAQTGLVEQFDATIGRSTVLLPYGGLLQATETQVSVQKLPTEGYTDTASVMAFGCDPALSVWSPYHGAAYAVVTACAKIVSSGASYERLRFSYQEYFERMTADPHSWGKPLAALLGALKMQAALGLPSIGGKDSMSGTFERLNVPPTLVAFGITTVRAGQVISPEFKWEGNRIYLIRHTPLADRMPDTEQLKANWRYVTEQIRAGRIVSAFATGDGGVAEALCKMAFGNLFGVRVKVAERDLFGALPGSLVVEAEGELDFPQAVLLGQVTSGEDGLLHVNGHSIRLSALRAANEECFAAVYPTVSRPDMKRVLPEGLEGVRLSEAGKAGKKGKAGKDAGIVKYPGVRVERPVAFLPVFPGTNCEEDTARAFRKAGAEVRFSVFCNQDEADIRKSLAELKRRLSECHIFVLCGGFSAGDEPDGSGKFIANVLNNKEIAEEVQRLLDRGGLILGICNGFQALLKAGLLPYGRVGMARADTPTLFRNDIGRHVARMVTTRVASTRSPWLAGLHIGDRFTVPVSHGEGKFVVGKELAAELFARGQVAFQYVDPLTGNPTMESPYNPNGSYYAVEGLLSRDGRILGKMGHSERYEKNLFRNSCAEELEQPLFENAVRYFRKGRKP